MKIREIFKTLCNDCLGCEGCEVIDSTKKCSTINHAIELIINEMEKHKMSIMYQPATAGCYNAGINDMIKVLKDEEIAKGDTLGFIGPNSAVKDNK